MTLSLSVSFCLGINTQIVLTSDKHSLNSIWSQGETRQSIPSMGNQALIVHPPGPLKDRTGYGLSSP